MGDPIFDLFGDLVPEGRGKPGRPQHVPTIEKRNRVKMLLAVGWNDERIAGTIGVSIKTLRKHYSRELVARVVCRDRLEARRLEVLWRQGCDGNVAAMREFGRLLDATQAEAADRDFARLPTPSAKLGKKEQAQVDAENVAETDAEWGRLMTFDAPAPVH